VAVATGGASPALARAVRERIERLLPPDYALLAEAVADVRRELRARGLRPDVETWSHALAEVMGDMIVADRPDDTRARLLDRLGLA
jgi:uroporphyrin-III C-methyltransferase/precorrin-2 dehydrogenase/sirohydrochlorin ferrochelatase